MCKGAHVFITNWSKRAVYRAGHCAADLLVVLVKYCEEAADWNSENPCRLFSSFGSRDSSLPLTQLQPLSPGAVLPLSPSFTVTENLRQSALCSRFSGFILRSAYLRRRFGLFRRRDDCSEWGNALMRNRRMQNPLETAHDLGNINFPTDSKKRKF